MKKKKINGGFTLVELLATLAILSLILSIVIYTSVGVIDTAKEKSYEVTENNVKVAAVNYVMEEKNDNDNDDYDIADAWIEMPGSVCVSEKNCEMQCVKINDMVEKGYLSRDSLDSPVGEGEYLHKDDYIYIERDAITKAITSRDLYNERCGHPGASISIENQKISDNYDKVSYDIVYTLIPTGITYEVSYGHANSGVNSGIIETKTSQEFIVEINKNGLLYANVQYIDNDGERKSLTVNQNISEIDDVAPVISSVTSTNNMSSSQKLTINASDEGGSGIFGYYVGKSSPNGTTVYSTDNTGTITDSGMYNISVKDKAGNTSTTQTVVYFKTTFSVSGVNVSPGSVLTKSGNSFTLPSVGSGVTFIGTNNTFDGWYNGGTKVTGSYTPVGDVTLTGTGKTMYTVTFKSNGSTYATRTVQSGGTVSNPGTPTRSGYSFTGWKLNGSAYDFSSSVKSNLTIEAGWVQNYTVTFISNGSTYATRTVQSGGTVSNPGTPTRSGYTFTGWKLDGINYVFGSAVIKDLTIEAGWQIEQQDNPIVVTANSLTYNGNYQQLVTVKNAQGTVWYSVGTQINSSNYNGVGQTSIPTKKDEGTYTVYWYVTGNANYKSKSGSVGVTIAPGCTYSCEADRTLVSGKCCPSGYTSVSGNYCVKKNYTLSGNKCYFQIYIGTQWGKMDDNSGRVTCEKYGSNWSYDSFSKTPTKVDKSNCPSSIMDWLFNGCWDHGYLICKSSTIGDCAVTATSQVCR